MRKLKLQDLEVMSFVVNVDGGKALGTVKANSASTTYYPPSYDTFCPTAIDCNGGGTDGPDSCMPSCFNYTCEGATCKFVIC